MRHHQETDGIHAELAAQLDMLARDIGLGAMRGDADIARAGAVGHVQVVGGDAQAFVRAGEHGSGLVISVGTGEQTSLRDLWSSIAGLAGKQPQFRPAADDEIARFALSPMRARIHLSWSPWTSLADGLVQLR